MKPTSFASLTTTLNTLTPYVGVWTSAEANHLLRRTTFGCNAEQVQEVVDLGLQVSLNRLFSEQPRPDPPLNYSYPDDPYVAIGDTWVDAPYVNRQQVRNHRNRSLAGWQVLTILEEGISIREKLTLFWNNHFSVANVNDPKFIYRYISLLRENAWGNARDLIKAIIIDPAMLRFLNGNQNAAASPNENFARELLELYTIGKGPLAGPEDYTNYTEDDVREIARALTGWRDRGYLSATEEVSVGAIFRPGRHDQGNKQLSHRFNDQVITNAGDQEYKTVVDIIFQQREVARFLCRKLYRWFVYYEIDQTTEENIIEPLAQHLIDHDFEIKPALMLLLGSQHFFDVLNRGPMIKNPYDFSLGLFKQNKVALPKDNLRVYYDFAVQLYGFIATMDMAYFTPPSVAGWKAYYQEPVYYRIWINSSTLRPRMLLTDVFATVGFRLPGNNRIQIDVFEMVAQLSQPNDPNVLIQELAERFYPQPLIEEQRTGLKEILIPGLPDFEWTVEYNLFLEDPGNNEIRASVELKLRTLLQKMLSLPEYYLS
jgi:uncharacterized protein (DUF1800 family)